jgi:hypothetical protein
VYWNEFRAAYPYHAQGIAISDPQADGLRTMVVAEPPPSVTLEEIIAAAPAGSTAVVKPHQLGVDGWTKDVVLRIRGDADIRAISAQLHRVLYGTAYRASDLPIPPPPLMRGFKEPQVGPPDVRDWVRDASHRAVDVVDGSIVSAEALLAAENAGVYASIPEGVILWSVPRGNIDDRTRECRMFAVDSDLILGAYADRDEVVIIGRRRALPIATYAPIRCEGLRALTSTGELELAQSFQRNHTGAGKIPDGVESGWDWAPIYLSPGVLDTEVGSTLNLADQLLKSWSNAGETHYRQFDYPAPPKYPFDTSVYKKVGAESLIYNWNTSGFATLFELGDRTFLNFSYTTALPVTYIPGGDAAGAKRDAAGELADAARDAFAATDDPVLVHAAQYAALYQIAFNFDFTSEDVAPTVGADTESATSRQVGRAIDRLAAASDADLAKAARAIGLSPSTPSEGGAPAVAPAADEGARVKSLLAELREAIQAMSPQDREKLGRLVESTDAEDDDDPVVLLAREVILSFIDKEALKKDLMAAASTRASAWIRTPSVVVSRDAAMPELEGGHDIDPMPTRLVIDPKVPRNRMARVEGGGLAVNEADLSRWSQGPLLDTARAPAAPASPAWNVEGSADVVGHHLSVERGSSGFVVALSDEHGALVRRWSVATSAQASDLVEMHASKARAGIKDLTFRGFDDEARDAFVRTLDVRADRAARIEVLGDDPRLQLQNLKGRYRMSDAELGQVGVKSVDGGVEMTVEVAVPNREATKKGLLISIVHWFRDLLPEGATGALATIKDSALSVVNRWRMQNQATVDDLARQMRVELRKATKKNPTLRVHVRDEGRSGYLVEDEPASAPSHG